MNISDFAILFGIFSVGTIVGMFTTALLAPLHDDSDATESAPQTHDTTLLNYLEQSECNLFFNPEIGAWGLLDGGNKMLATAHTVRNTLGRARDRDAADGVACEDKPHTLHNTYES